MTLRNQIRKIVTGLAIPQEYVCLNGRDFQNPLSVVLMEESSKISFDVTATHLFLGYKPLIIGFPINTSNEKNHVIRNLNQVSLSFVTEQQTEIAKLTLKKIGEKTVDEKTILLYEGEYGSHSFLNSIHQFVSRQREKMRKHSSNNVSLPGNLMEQVRIAYSVPRTISVITLSDGNLMNMFPTDLHGSVGENFYVGSLRRGGKANEQVEKYEQIVISRVEASFYKQAYSLGKNHMRELQAENKFELHIRRSKHFNFPLPLAVTFYREMKKINSFDHGIHRIHLYEIIHQQVVQEERSTLAHIHQYYAQWREDQGLKTDYLFR